MSYVTVTNMSDDLTGLPLKKCTVMGIPEEVAMSRFPVDFKCRKKKSILFGDGLRDAVKVEAFPHLVFEELRKMGTKMSYVIVTNRFIIECPTKKCTVMGIPEEVAMSKFPHDFNCRKKTSTLGDKLQDAVKVDAFPHTVFEELRKMGYELISSTSHHEHYVLWTFAKKHNEFS